MTDITPLLPRQPVPALSFPLVGGGRFSVAEAAPERFTLLVFYRGLHCPICKSYLNSLQKLLPEFEKRGVTVVVTSTDTAERAERAKAEWKIDALDVGYGVTLEEARAFGLYVSTSRGVTSAGVEEPERFAEPGLFIIKPDNTLFFASVQTMPFARPRFEDIVPALDFVIEKDYPARGEVAAISGKAATAA